MPHESVLYGTRDGDEDWQEELLSTKPDRFEAVKKIARTHGFRRFRIATIDLSVAPDFRRILNQE